MKYSVYPCALSVSVNHLKMHIGPRVLKKVSERASAKQHQNMFAYHAYVFFFQPFFFLIIYTFNQKLRLSQIC